jgi:hypothetical protein
LSHFCYRPERLVFYHPERLVFYRPERLVFTRDGAVTRRPPA